MAVEATSPLHPGEASSALEARDVRLRYGRRGPAALDQVSMTVPRGSITALVGPNGAGKSSLMRSFVGFEHPQRGTLFVLGHDVAKQRTEALACAGYLAQDSQLYRGLTVARHIDLVEGLRASFDRADAMVTLERMRIPLRVRASNLSGGQQVLAALALVLATRAPVLILDEPLGALDVLARREFLALLVAEVRQRGTSVLMASHVIADMASTCDRVVAIAGGQVVLELGTGEALAAHRLVGGTVTGTGVIGSFLGLDGSPVTLVRSGDQTLPPPDLEALVAGYLASSRAASQAPAA
jgi:ABC-2 type transport system ATP-binding protein